MTSNGTCSYGDIRLVGGSNQYEGRVEVCINDQWGTVCDDSWGTTDATIVCKQLGYAYTGSKFELFSAFTNLLWVICPLLFFSLARLITSLVVFLVLLYLSTSILSYLLTVCIITIPLL